MAFSNTIIKPSNNVKMLLAPIVFGNVRSTVQRTSNRKRQCYGTGNVIVKGDSYINHQFRYDTRIVTISFSVEFFYGTNLIK
tara:strand:- start:1183 stop:1428 length:246 start_codon:yes stop_codon:yes gene_type:complete